MFSWTWEDYVIQVESHRCMGSVMWNCSHCVTMRACVFVLPEHFRELQSSVFFELWNYKLGILTLKRRIFPIKCLFCHVEKSERLCMTPSCGAAITRAFTKTMNTCGRLISVSDCSTNIIITQIYYSMTYNMHCKVSIVTLEELDTVSVVQ